MAKSGSAKEKEKALKAGEKRGSKTERGGVQVLVIAKFCLFLDREQTP